MGWENWAEAPKPELSTIFLPRRRVLHNMSRSETIYLTVWEAPPRSGVRRLAVDDIVTTYRETTSLFLGSTTLFTGYCRKNIPRRKRWSSTVGTEGSLLKEVSEISEKTDHLSCYIFKLCRKAEYLKQKSHNLQHLLPMLQILS